MSGREAQLPPKVSIARLKKSFSSLALSTLSNLSFTTKSDVSSITSSSSTLRTSLEDTDILHGTSDRASCRDYPGQLGEELHNCRYILARKLGKGNYSTVWLAKDTEQNNYVALKILTTKATRCHAMHITDEVSILKWMSTAGPSHPGFVHTVALSDNFSLNSPYGEHLCLAFKDVLGQSMCDLRQRSPTHVLPLGSVQRIFRQVALALEYLHDCCNIVHTDLKPDSILVCLDDPQHAIEQLLEHESTKSHLWGKVDTRDLPMSPLPTPAEVIMDPHLKIKLIDFGHAQRIDERLTDQIQPPSLRAPEVILGYTWGTGVDIWSLGCVVFELLTSQWLFQPKASSTHAWTAEDQHLQRMVEYTGQIFPEDMVTESSHGTEFFDELGRFRRIRSLHPLPIEKALGHYRTIQDSEIPETAGFIRRCLTLDPRKRATAKDLLSDRWLGGCS